MGLIRQNEGAKIILHAKSPTFRTAKFNSITVCYLLTSKSYKGSDIIKITFLILHGVFEYALHVFNLIIHVGPKNLTVFRNL